jgi:hypothetical protein
LASLSLILNKDLRICPEEETWCTTEGKKFKVQGALQMMEDVVKGRRGVAMHSNINIKYQ